MTTTKPTFDGKGCWDARSCLHAFPLGTEWTGKALTKGNRRRPQRSKFQAVSTV